jgi:hypothetical protein
MVELLGGRHPPGDFPIPEADGALFLFGDSPVFFLFPFPLRDSYNGVVVLEFIDFPRGTEFDF